ncbi:O-antigen ligase family protein [Patescibacteria group bacterium]|nr:O-antigen ligase family protein [Patescibacteria group bacterium]MBU1673287.1 O-antigen ligase family protein [Patescibacteria group bacterium]MBU1963340.1 O-antigen ligase family protein [Patescibacteria group bacterium]
MFGLVLVYLLVALFPFINLQFEWGDINVPWVDMVALVMLPYVIYLILKNKKFTLKENFPGFFFYLFWLISAGLSLMNVPFDMNDSVQYFFRPLGFFYLMYLIVPWNILKDFGNKKVFKNIFYIFFGLGVFASLMGFWAYLFSDAVSFLARRAGTTAFFGLYPLGGSHNQIAEVLVAVIPFALILFWLEKKDSSKRFLVVATVFMAIITLLTFSRSGWISLGLEFFLLMILVYKAKLMTIFKYTLVMLLILMPLAIYMALFSQQEFVSSSTQNRSVLINMAWEFFRDHPIVGNGPGVYREMVLSDKFYVLEYGEYADAHGFLQQTAAEQGILGFVGFLALLAYVCFVITKAYLKNRDDPYWGKVLLGAMMVAIGTISFQIFQTSYYNSKLWVPLGMAMILALKSLQDGAKDSSHN